MRFSASLLVFGVLAGAAAAEAQQLGIGRAATPQELGSEDIDVRADGAGLPPGQGSAEQGAALFASTCAACHGERGEHPVIPALRLVGGRGTLATPGAVQTVGSYWPYATTLFDYIRRAMPFSAPRSLTDDQVYAVTAYILQLNGIVPEGTVLDAATLPEVQMPNRNGFVGVYAPSR